MSQVNFCQSCGMPLSEESQLGTNNDGTKNHEYCTYCYQNGSYTNDCTMDEMIQFCIGPMVENNANLTEESARKMMEGFFPTLKRWSQAQQ